MSEDCGCEQKFTEFLPWALKDVSKVRFALELLERRGGRSTSGSISSTFYMQLLRMQNPKAQKDTDNWTQFLCFWDLHSLKLSLDMMVKSNLDVHTSGNGSSPNDDVFMISLVQKNPMMGRILRSKNITHE
jgi:hypothetical protein